MQVNIISFSLQALLWFLFLTVPLFSNPERFSDPGYLTAFIIKHITYLAIFYTNYFLFIPKILKSKGLTVYFMISFLAMGLVFVLNNLTEVIFMRPPGMRFFLFFDIIPIIQVYAVSISFRLIVDYFRQIETQKILEEQNKQAQLNFLRSQINPHFLFNTLNNINALVRLKPNEAEKSIGNLSELMRYILLSGKLEKTELGKEIEYIKNYIELQKLRLMPGFNLSCEFELKNETKMIEPLLLIGFIENSFKHGISGKEDDFIDIKLSDANEYLELESSNRLHPLSNFNQIESGIGLENIKKRLEICYKGRYKLNTKTTDNIYKITLRINL